MLVVVSLGNSISAKAATSIYGDTIKDLQAGIDESIKNGEVQIEINFNEPGSQDIKGLFSFAGIASIEDESPIGLDYASYNLDNIWWAAPMNNNKDDWHTTTLNIEYRNTIEETTYVADEVKKILSENSQVSVYSDYEKYVWIYNYITSHIVYDNSLLNRSAYAALKYGNTTCGGYASLYYAMAKELELPCRIALGNANGRHAWNLGQLDGKWYFIDTTWGAATKDNRFLLKAKNNITTHSLDPAILEYGFDFAETDYDSNDAEHNITVEPEKTIFLGETNHLVLSNKNSTALQFSSEDSSICKISDTGELEGVNTGTTIIHVISTEESLDKTCKITVEQAINSTKTESIETVYGKTVLIKIKGLAEHISKCSYRYSIEDESIAVLNVGENSITGIRAGKTSLNVVYGVNDTVVNIPIIVKPIINAKLKSFNLKVKHTKDLSNAVTISGNGAKDITFRSTNKKLATVTSKGKLVAVKKGSCSINVYDKKTNKVVATIKVKII